MTMRVTSVAFAIFASSALAACEDAPETRETDCVEELIAQDPIVARALADPLMVDPDLAWRSEANAAITFRDDHPLPAFEARADAASRAVEAARVELLADGQIPALPAPADGEGEPALGDLTTAAEIVTALDARPDCIERMDGRLDWSTKMPVTSSVMPHGMVRQAAGVDVGTCVIRVVRYVTPAAPSDVLEYHFTKVDRARFSIERFDAPEAQLRADRRDQAIAVHVREGPGGMSAVDVVHWRK